MKKKLSKKTIILIVVGVLVVGAITGVLVIKSKLEKVATGLTSYIRTVDINYDSLQETIVGSGTIESQTTSSITTNATAIVSKINYDVGDYVKEGDVIIELDTSSINKQIEQQSNNINKQKRALQNTYESAQDDYYDAEDKYGNSKLAYYNAYNAYKYAEDELNATKQRINYIGTVGVYNSYIDKCIEDYGKTCDLLEDGQKPAEYENAKKALEDADRTLEDVKEIYNYEGLKLAYESAEAAYKAAKTSYDTQEGIFEKQEFTYKEGVDTNQLEDLNETLIDYKLKAKTSGQITSMNAVLGSTASGNLATIQDTGKLKISLVIDEYDILRLNLGMKAIVETDASDKKYEGEITMISPTANTTKDGANGFGVDVSIISDDVSDLLIGMNAEVTIVLSESEKNFNVPIDAVEDKDDGTSVIYVKNETGGFDEVKVTKGKDNGYLIEVFGNLHEGMKVRASANAFEAAINEVTNTK